MISPKLCPICGSGSIEPTFHSTKFSVAFDQVQCAISGLRAYHCSDSHLFIVVGGKSAIERHEVGQPRASLLAWPSQS